MIIDKLVKRRTTLKNGKFENFKMFIFHINTIFLLTWVCLTLPSEIVRTKVKLKHFANNKSVFTFVVIKLQEPEPDQTPTKMYAICAVTYLGAMVASNSSLKFVAYPMQVLGKSCKPIPGE